MKNNDNYLQTIYPFQELNEYDKRFYSFINEKFITKIKCDKNQYNFLDLGCGKGFSKYISFINNKVKWYGVDKRGNEFKCDLEKEKLPFENEYFDCVFSKSLIEHITNTENILKESYRVLKMGGFFICLTPDWSSHLRCFWDDYTHVKPFTLKSLKDCFLIHNFELEFNEYFYQLPIIWKYPWMKLFCRIINILPDSLKWKNTEMRNGKDRKFIRFSKEKMLLVVGKK